MELNKNTIEVLNSPLKTRYAIFTELETSKTKLDKVKYGINITFHINYAINNYVKEIHEKKIAELMSIRFPITQYWEEMESREKIINKTIIEGLNQKQAIKSEMESEE